MFFNLFNNSESSEESNNHEEVSVMEASERDSEIYESATIARYILDQHRKNPIPFLRMAKLSKLVYIAHGFYLGKYGKPLIDEIIVAGFDCPELHSLDRKMTNELKRIRSDIWEDEPEITFRALDFSSKEVLIAEAGNAQKINEIAKKEIKNVIEIYRDYDSYQITSATHQDETPWSFAVGLGQLYIDDEIIQYCYERMLKNKE